MKTLLATSINLILSLSLVVSSSAGPLRSGVATADITPKEWPLNLVGSFSPRPAEEVHDPLMARAVVLSDGVMTIAMVVKAKMIAKTKMTNLEPSV